MTARVGHLERLLEARSRANPAAELHVDSGRLAHAADQSQIHGLAALRAVEIDDVQPAGAELAVLPGELDGIDGVARLLREVAFEEPDAAPVSQINGGYQLHRHQRVRALILRKLPRICAPARDDRSGWNCVPKKLPCSTTAENGTP